MRKKLRIAMYLSSDPSVYGGVLNHVYYLSDALEKRGHEVTLVCANHSIMKFKRAIALGKAIPILMPNGNWANFTIGGNEVEKTINALSFDICHIHEPYTPFVSWNMLRSVVLPRVATFHSAWDTQSPLAWITSILPLLKDMAFVHIDGGIFTSKIVFTCWKRWCPKHMMQAVIGHAIHSSYKPIDEKKHETVELLFVARIVPKKGLHYVLQSLLFLSKQYKVHLTVIGDGPDKEKEERWAKEHGISTIVDFTGLVSEEEKIGFYQKSDIFLAPYVDEGFGFTVFEAMACGVPIVGFKNDAFTDTLFHYPGKKFLVKQHNLLSFRNAIEVLIKNEQLRKDLRMWCIEESKKFRWEYVAKETETLYYDVIKNYHHA